MARLNINGINRDVQVEPDTPLLWVIREQIGLTGTKYGCGVAACGACSVHINGEVMRSCSIRRTAGSAYQLQGIVRVPVALTPAPQTPNLREQIRDRDNP